MIKKPEFWLVLVGFATAGATIFLALESHTSIDLTREIYQNTNRPWLNIYLLKTEIDNISKKVEVKVQLKAMGNSPAKSISCYANSTPIPGYQGGGLSFPTSVLLPGETMDCKDQVIPLTGESFESVFTYHHEAKLKIECSYGVIGQEFHSSKTFLLDPQKPNPEYEEAPQSAELN